MWLDNDRGPEKDPGLSGRVLGSRKEVNVADLALQSKRNTLVNGRQRLGNDRKRTKCRRRIRALSVC